MSKCTQTENHKTTMEANSKRAKGRASCAGKPRWGEVGRERAATAALAERGCTNTGLESACRRRVMSTRCQALTGEIHHLCWEPTHGPCRELFSVSWCSVTASSKTETFHPSCRKSLKQEDKQLKIVSEVPETDQTHETLADRGSNKS